MTIQPKVCFNLFYYHLNVNWSILRQVVSIQKKWDYLIGMSPSLRIVLYGQRRRIEQYFWKSYILRYESLQRTSEAEGWNQKSSNSNSDKWCRITRPWIQRTQFLLTMQTTLYNSFLFCMLPNCTNHIYSHTSDTRFHE